MHKVTILAVVVGMYVCSKRQRVCSVCALHLSVGMNLSRQDSFRMHMGGVGVGVGEKVEVAGLCSGGSLVVLGVSEPQPECHIPFSG